MTAQTPISPVKRKKYHRFPAELPIELTIKNRGNTHRHVLQNGDTVNCIFCGRPITLDWETVFRYVHPYDDNRKIFCPECERTADAVYYASDKNRISLETWDTKFNKT